MRSGGIETPLASSGTTIFAAVNNHPLTLAVKGVTNGKAFEASLVKGTGEMIAVSQDTGKIIWAGQLPSSPSSAAVTKSVASTCTH